MGGIQSQPASTPAPPQPAAAPQPSAGNLSLPSVSRLTSYFVPLQNVLVSHSHPTYTPADLHAIQATLSALGLPPDLAQRILDYAGTHAVCRRESRRQLTVASTSDPRGVRSRERGGGQEDELGVEISLGEAGGLAEGPGRVWCLVSKPVGCDEDDDEGDKKRKEDTTRQGWGSWLDSPRLFSTAVSPSVFEERKGIDVPAAGLAPPTDRKRGAWVRSIVVDTFSRDQGWADTHAHYGTYEGSHSFFELTLMRGGFEVEGSRVVVQHNVVAGQYFKRHTVELDATHPLVQEATDGDRVVLWARAMYPGWVNFVKYVSVAIHWAPFPPQ